MQTLIICADDFGLDAAVNAAVAQAHGEGVLTCASLMVGAAAAAEAVAMARTMPKLGVGLHLTLVDGTPTLPPEQIPALVDSNGQFHNNMAMAGVKFFFLPQVRRQLAREIEAQFAAFATTGLRLDHVNTHKHFHIHPTITALLLKIGRAYGMKAVRVPDEPSVKPPFYSPWIKAQKTKLRRAGMVTNDQVLGLGHSGNMTEATVLPLLENLPPGITELYTHPATTRTPALVAAMPEYHHAEELAMLLSPQVREVIARQQIRLATYGDVVG